MYFRFQVWLPLESQSALRIKLDRFGILERNKPILAIYPDDAASWWGNHELIIHFGIPTALNTYCTLGP